MSIFSQIAIIQQDKCKPTKCNLECKKYCPVNRVGKLCIDVEKTSKNAIISETLCIGSKGCNICVKKCPFDAIMMVNIPKKLENDIDENEKKLISFNNLFIQTTNEIINVEKLNKKLCPICFENETDMCAIPCGHTCCTYMLSYTHTHTHN